MIGTTDINDGYNLGRQWKRALEFSERRSKYPNSASLDADLQLAQLKSELIPNRDLHPPACNFISYRNKYYEVGLIFARMTEKEHTTKLIIGVPDIFQNARKIGLD